MPNDRCWARARRGRARQRTQSSTFVTPNLTPNPKTGHIYAWSENVFVARFKNAVPTASPMPWGNFKNLSEDDLRALYRYLRSLPPATRPMTDS
jgi:hypothetical protein